MTRIEEVVRELTAKPALEEKERKEESELIQGDSVSTVNCPGD